MAALGFSKEQVDGVKTVDDAVVLVGLSDQLRDMMTHSLGFEMSMRATVVAQTEAEELDAEFRGMYYRTGEGSEMVDRLLSLAEKGRIRSVYKICVAACGGAAGKAHPHRAPTAPDPAQGDGLPDR